MIPIYLKPTQEQTTELPDKHLFCLTSLIWCQATEVISSPIFQFSRLKIKLTSLSLFLSDTPETSHSHLQMIPTRQFVLQHKLVQGPYMNGCWAVPWSIIVANFNQFSQFYRICILCNFRLWIPPTCDRIWICMCLSGSDPDLDVCGCRGNWKSGSNFNCI